MTPIHHPRMSHPFQGEGDPLRTHGEGAYQSVTSTKGGGEPRGGSTVMSHPFQEGVGGRDESPFHPKEGCLPFYLSAISTVPLFSLESRTLALRKQAISQMQLLESRMIFEQVGY